MVNTNFNEIEQCCKSRLDRISVPVTSRITTKTMVNNFVCIFVSTRALASHSTPSKKKGCKDQYYSGKYLKDCFHKINLGAKASERNSAVSTLNFGESHC